MRYYKGVNLMDTVTKQYIETVKVSDIPWHRLTTTYGRATDFPAHLEVLWDIKSIDAQYFGPALHHLLWFSCFVFLRKP